MSISRSAASASLALMLLVAAASSGEAATIAVTHDVATTFAAQHGASSRIDAPLLAQNPAAQCINGYRITHRVKNQGRITGGVILKCRS